MKKIITIPHTQSEHHTNGMIGGWSDRNLTELGIEQAKRIGENLSREIKDQNYVMYCLCTRRRIKNALYPA